MKNGPEEPKAEKKKKKKKKKNKKNKLPLLPESSFNVQAANFVPSGFVIPSDVKVKTTEAIKEEAEPEESSKTISD